MLWRWSTRYALAVLLSSSLASACGRGRQLQHAYDPGSYHSQDSMMATGESGNKQQKHAHHVHESRIGEDWSYVPNYALSCTEVGCCGRATADIPDRQACGPEFWKYLNEDTALRCVPETGGQQSPINFQTLGDDSLDFMSIGEKDNAGGASHADAHLVFSKNLCQGKLEFLANTWEVVFDQTCPMHVDVLGKRWHLAQWHLHNAEHSINGLYYPLEVHMVHTNQYNETLVIATFLTVGPNNRFFDQLKSHDANERLRPLNAYEIVPQDGKFWHYTGSLTTPPCQTKEGAVVQWFVMQTPITIAADQMYTFTSYFVNLDKAYNGHVNRPIQDVLITTSIFTSLEEPALRMPEAVAFPMPQRLRNYVRVDDGLVNFMQMPVAPREW